MARVAAEDGAVRAAPSGDAETVDTLVTGDIFAVLEYAGGWAWGYVQSSHRVGYVPAHVLRDPA